MIVHATTVVTNALIERKGRATALLVTEGFRDILTIRNEHRYEMYDPQIEFPEPLIPRELTFGVAERMLADGNVLQALDAAQVDAHRRRSCKRRACVSVAVCLLNAYRQPGQRARGGRDDLPSALRPTCTSRSRPTSRRRSANIRAPRPRR